MQQELLPAEKIPHEETALVVTPMDLLRIATEQNADIDKLTKLMELKERWEANEARKAYNQAMTEFKSHAPEIDKNHRVRYENKDGSFTEYDHATLDHVCELISPALSAHGITHRWKTEQVSGVIRVTCILKHRDGHEESCATLEGMPDNSGGKNGVQAIASTVSYLERYTLLAATGMASKGQDNDGAGTAGGVAEDWLKERIEWIANCRNLDELKKIYKDAYEIADKAKDKPAMKAIIDATTARKKELAK